jgi:hypothetical protein
LGKAAGETPDVGGDRVSVPGELQGDLLVVACREKVRALPREVDGGEGLVRNALQRESSLHTRAPKHRAKPFEHEMSPRVSALQIEGCALSSR